MAKGSGQGQDRAKPNSAFPYADGVQYDVCRLLKYALTLLT
ncbi:MAG TPA: hypothetical protein VFR94_07820 [Nitrososphaeraceae archaeon]|nr:hypothetical protein [Nitrososphaeraceae archaeon]